MDRLRTTSSATSSTDAKLEAVGCAPLAPSFPTFVPSVASPRLVGSASFGTVRHSARSSGYDDAIGVAKRSGRKELHRQVVEVTAGVRQRSFHLHCIAKAEATVGTHASSSLFFRDL